MSHAQADMIEPLGHARIRSAADPACRGTWSIRRARRAGMDLRNDVTEAIGRTPLIRLRGASELTGCEIWAKAEFMNPGQSVKDRAALFIIRDAIDRGELRPDGVVVDGTAGNT